LEPALASGIERLHHIALQAGHVQLDLVADARLRIRKMPVPLGKALQQGAIERWQRARRHWVEAVLLVDGLAQHHAPSSFTLLDEIVEAAGAKDVAQHAIHEGAL